VSANSTYDAYREASEGMRDGPLPTDWPEIKALPEPGDDPRAEYPFELLPHSLQIAATEVARFTKTPIESASTIGVSVISAAIGKKAIVQERPGLTHHPALFFVPIAASGERKSPPFKLMQRPLETWIKSREIEYQEAERRYMANCMVVDARIGKLKKDAAKMECRLEREQIQNEIVAIEGERMPRPVEPRMFTSDITEERLFQKMHAHGGEFAVFSGEGRPVLDGIMGKYSGKDRTGDAIYLAGISGDVITRDRVGGENGPEGRVIYMPCLSICVMVQPDKYLEVARNPALRSSGALARIWPAWLPSLVGYRIEEHDEPGLRDDALVGYEQMVASILNSVGLVDAVTGESVPHRLTMSGASKDARRKIHNEIEKLMRNGGDLDDVRDIASKAVSQFCKLALVLKLANEPNLLESGKSIIDEATWLAAQGIGMFHLQEAVRVQRMADESQVTDVARRVLAWIRRKDFKEVTARTVCQYCPRPRPDAKQADEALELLADHGYLMEWKAAGRRKMVHKVNPNFV
jgi:Protein of unknown function (DUF3987)